MCSLTASITPLVFCLKELILSTWWVLLPQPTSCSWLFSWTLLGCRTLSDPTPLPVPCAHKPSTCLYRLKPTFRHYANSSTDPPARQLPLNSTWTINISQSKWLLLPMRAHPSFFPKLSLFVGFHVLRLALNPIFLRISINSWSFTSRVLGLQMCILYHFMQCLRWKPGFHAYLSVTLPGEPRASYSFLYINLPWYDTWVSLLDYLT